MKRSARWLAGLACGLAGCTWIIGDIPVPDDVRVDAAAIAGDWVVYGIADGLALHDRLSIAADGAVTLADAAVTRAEVEASGLWHLDLGPGIGEVTGRFAAASGVALMVQSRPADPAAFVMLVRAPTTRATLLGGRTLHLGVTEDGRAAEFGRLELMQGDYRQSARYRLTGDRLDNRAVEFEDAPGERWRAVFEDETWLLSPLLQGNAAIGVDLGADGAPRGPFVLWREPVDAGLVDRDLFCAGLALEDGAVVSRMRGGRILDDRVTWSDGRHGTPRTVQNTAVFEGDGSFFDDQGTLILPDADNRLFALMPIVPAAEGTEPTRAWGIALCIGLDAVDPPDLGVDAGPADAGDDRGPDAGPDATPDAAPMPDQWVPDAGPSPDPDASPDLSPDAG